MAQRPTRTAWAGAAGLVDVRYLSSRLTERLNIAHPVVSAPIGQFAGGALATDVSRAGGLGMVGAGGATTAWLVRQLDIAAGARIGCGFVTWELGHNPALLDVALERGPVVVVLTAGDVTPYAERIRDAGALLALEASTIEEVRRVLEHGPDVVVLRGTEAAGHGPGTRSMMTLVPEVCDLLERTGIDPVVLAAGGVADGRGLAATLMLGADGVEVSTRFVLAPEALVPSVVQDRLARACGDDTVRTSLFDDLIGSRYPPDCAARLLRSGFIRAWGQIPSDVLRDGSVCEAVEQLRQGIHDVDVDVIDIAADESVGLVSRREHAGSVVETMVAEAVAAFDSCGASAGRRAGAVAPGPRSGAHDPGSSGNSRSAAISA